MSETSYDIAYIRSHDGEAKGDGQKPRDMTRNRCYFVISMANAHGIFNVAMRSSCPSVTGPVD